MLRYADEMHQTKLRSISTQLANEMFIEREKVLMEFRLKWDNIEQQRKQIAIDYMNNIKEFIESTPTPKPTTTLKAATKPKVTLYAYLCPTPE